jgi:CelD/BcsL family acetyltransferase involved in cellulose biosynthesis
MNGVNSQFGSFQTGTSVGRMYAPTTAARWSFALDRGAAGLARWRADWQSLVDSTDRASFVQAPAWISSYLGALAARPDDVCFIAARFDGRLQAILALEHVRHGPAGIGPASLRLITGDHLPLADIAGDASAPGLWPGLLRWLERDSGLAWSALFAAGLCADGSFAGTLRTAPARQRGVFQTCHPSLWLDCSADVAHALRDVSKSHRVNVRRLTRRAREIGPLDYEIVTAPGRLDAAFDAFLQVEGSGWKAQQGSAIRLHTELVAFYRGLMEQFGTRGECRINLLRLNGAVIAAQFGVIAGRQLNLLKIGYAEEHANLAPGHLIMQHTIESVCADAGLDRLSFVTHPPWAALWKPESTAIEHHVVFRSSWAGRLLRQALRAWQRRPGKGRTEAPAAASDPAQ